MAHGRTRTHGRLPPRYPSPHAANILFCFFNEQYWLYAVENYAYNLYFLLIVAYVARAYVLKGRTARTPEEKNNARGRDKMIFYGVFVAVVVLYSVIFVASVVREVDSERDDDSGKVRYCEGTPAKIQKWNTSPSMCSARS